MSVTRASDRSGQGYPFTVTTHTGSDYFSGTDSNVSIILYGTKGESGLLPLKYLNDTNAFETGKVDTFNVQTKDLGALHKVKIAHDNKGTAAGWYLDKVTVEDGKTKANYTFPCNRWLAEGDGYGLEAELICEKSASYKITTVTGNKPQAGTDARVYITLYGENGQSDELLLKGTVQRDVFEKGQSDDFDVVSKPLGMLYKVKIYHDNNGYDPSWFLKTVEVEDKQTRRKYVFPCNTWLKWEGNYSLEAELELKDAPIVKIDQLNSKNRSEHHTSKFETDGLIIRRGQTFELDIHLARPYNPQKDVFYLTLASGLNPRERNKTLVTIPLVKEFDDMNQRWAYKITHVQNNKLEVEVNCPADSLVSKYTLTVERDDETIYTHDKWVFILFNPWCEEDEVYMKDEEKRREYIVRQHGCIYVGSSKVQSPKKWYFGQFEDVVLDQVFKMLGNIPAVQRLTPVDVARKVSALVNSNDDDGVLVGNWSGKYDDGKSPLSWISSPPIFDSFSIYESSVKYGQCWVFSALVTSVMRCLGIPCRPVTNFNSAHDSDKNSSHDIYLDEEGAIIEGATNDSIWNFHCWNDVWMTRQDLPPGYGGWQAIDATPQELSRGLFQMGPASLRAVKEGEVDLPYDTKFVLSEVNSDVIRWKKNESTGKWEVVGVIRDHVGKKISTKAVGKWERADITDAYKFEEGSVLERAAVKKALTKSGNLAVADVPRDAELKIEAPDSVYVGDDVLLQIVVRNSGGKDMKILLTVGGNVMRYNGVSKARLEDSKKSIVVKRGTGCKTTIKYGARSYMSHLNESSYLRFYATSIVHETGQVCSDTEIIEITKPTLTFEGIPANVKNGKELQVRVCFRNPLYTELTDAELALDGTLMPERITYSIGTVKFREALKLPIALKVNAVPGSRSLLASFTSTQLSGLCGDTKVRVS